MKIYLNAKYTHGFETKPKILEVSHNNILILKIYMDVNYLTCYRAITTNITIHNYTYSQYRYTRMSSSWNVTEASLPAEIHLYEVRSSDLSAVLVYVTVSEPVCNVVPDLTNETVAAGTPLYE